MKFLFKILLFINILFPYCVTFNLDLNNFDDVPVGSWVARANGSWNEWGTGITLNDNDNDGIYSATSCSFDNGDYEYVFVITGQFDNWSGWGMSGNPPLGSSCDFKWWDSWANYGFNIQNADYETDVYPWSCCNQIECVDSNWDGCVGAGIKTIDSFQYGRFETRMKSADGDGMVSSFFTYNTDFDNGLGNLNWNEIDIEMTGNKDSSVQFTTHHPGSPNSWSVTEIVDVDFNPHQEFRDYAFEWTPGYIKWFIDNVEVYQQVSPSVDDLNLSQKLMMNLWAANAPSWTGDWNYQAVPKFSYYDYVKYFSYNPGLGDYGTNNNFIFEWQDNLENYNSNIWSNESGDQLGHCGFNQSNINYYHGHLIMVLRDASNTLSCNGVNGDINSDYQLNVSDVVFLISVILDDTYDDLDICEIIASDYDFNQTLNVSDVVGLVNYIIQ